MTFTSIPESIYMQMCILLKVVPFLTCFYVFHCFSKYLTILVFLTKLKSKTKILYFGDFELLRFKYLGT